MIETVLYTADADDDVAKAYRWYRKCGLSIGEDFLQCLEDCLLDIQRHPEIFPVVADTFRRGLISRFPFEVFYEVEEDALIVYAVFHCSQDPNKWKGRLGLD